MVNVLSDQELQRMYATVLASYPTDAKIYDAGISNNTTVPNFTTADPKQDTFKCRVEYGSTKRELDQTTALKQYILVQTWTAFVPKFVSVGVPSLQSDPTSGDWFLALGYRFRVESIESPYTHQLFQVINLRWVDSDPTEYGTYAFTGQAPFDVLLTEAGAPLLTEAGAEIAL